MSSSRADHRASTSYKNKTSKPTTAPEFLESSTDSKLNRNNQFSKQFRLNVRVDSVTSSNDLSTASVQQTEISCEGGASDVTSKLNPVNNVDSINAHKPTPAQGQHNNRLKVYKAAAAHENVENVIISQSINTGWPNPFRKL